jgi:ribosome-associated translation inhibitor RaiA
MNQLHLRCDQVFLGDQLRSYIEGRIEQAMERIRDKVHEIHLNIEDINGPNRKGLDKQAKLVVRWTNKQSLVIEDKDATLGVLLHRMMDRLELALERRTNRNQEKRNKH